MRDDERWEASDAPDPVDPEPPDPDDEDPDLSDDEEDESEEESEASAAPATAPAAAAQPSIHLHVGGGGRATKKKKKDEPPDPEREDKVKAFIGLFRRGNRPNAGLELRIHRVAPEQWDFGDGRGMRLCKGYKGTIYDPGEASEAYIKDHWGGQKFMLQLVGPDAKTGKGQRILEQSYVDIDADPKPDGGAMGTAPYAPSVPAASAVRVGPEESRLLATAMAGTTAATERANVDRVAAEERAHAAMREASDAKASMARAQAEADGAKSRLQSLEARIDDLQKQLLSGGGPQAGGDKMLALIVDMRREDATRYQEELRRREKDEERRLQASSNPLLDFVKQQEAAHERERKAEADRQRAYLDAEAKRSADAAERDRQFFAMQLKFAEEQRARLADEMKELRADKKKGGDLLGQISQLAEVREHLDVLTGGGDSGTTLETVMKGVADIGGKLPAIGVGLRHLIFGGNLPMQALPPTQEQLPPGAIGGEGDKPGAEEADEREARAQIARLISILEATLANGLAPEKVAERILRTDFSPQLIEGVRTAESEQLLVELRKIAPAGSPLTTFGGAEHVRKVHAAIKNAKES